MTPTALTVTSWVKKVAFCHKMLLFSEKNNNNQHRMLTVTCYCVVLSIDCSIESAQLPHHKMRKQKAKYLAGEEDKGDNNRLYFIGLLQIFNEVILLTIRKVLRT